MKPGHDSPPDAAVVLSALKQKQHKLA